MIKGKCTLFKFLFGQLAILNSISSSRQQRTHTDIKNSRQGILGYARNTSSHENKHFHRPASRFINRKQEKRKEKGNKIVSYYISYKKDITYRDVQIYAYD